MYRKTLIAGLAIIAIPALPATAFAEDGDPAPSTATQIDPLVVEDSASPDGNSETALTTEPVASQTAIAPAREDGSLSDTDLLELRGGQAIVVGNQTLTAISNGNAFNGNYTAGNIALSDSALSNFNGLGNLVINTGAQNNLQSAMNVTINFAQ